MGDYVDALSFIGTNIASGAASSIGGDAAGWVLSSIFGSSGPSSQQLLDAIQELGRQLTSIQNSLNVMQADLDKNFAEIEKDLQQINQQQLYLSWQTADNEITDYINQISTQYSTYVEYAANAKSATPEEVASLVAQIIDTDNGAKVSLNGISAYVVGGGQSKGVFELWVAMITPLVQNGSITYSAAVASYINYATKILYAQMQAINLIVEAYNQQKSNTIAQSEYGLYKTLATSQETPFLQGFEQLQFNAMWPGGTWFTQKNSASGSFTYDYIPLIQGLYAGTKFATAYSPTPTRMLAEQLLASAQAPKPADRRIVVWMIYDQAQTGMTLPYDFSGVDVSIQSQSSALADAGPIDPDATTTVTTAAMYPLVGIVLPSQSWTRIARRNVFSSVGDGSYQLFDMNGTYPPITGSNQAMDYFMDPEIYLPYVLRVDAGRQFDFMDFTVYCDPTAYTY